MNRGILVTEYASLKKEVTKAEIREIYETYYGKEPFIRILDDRSLPGDKMGGRK